ncbi:hypothetical protein [Streptomyces sp. NBC_01431]|nr:hypothetical protein [Streptomyces sp. NBC_01431]
MSGRNLDEEAKPGLSKRELAVQTFMLIARASQAAYWMYKLWKLL